ncbi:hypothetical protein ACQB60_02785 [Actinomycetota bacterium Odt1-20B]
MNPNLIAAIALASPAAVVTTVSLLGHRWAGRRADALAAAFAAHRAATKGPPQGGPCGPGDPAPAPEPDPAEVQTRLAPVVSLDARRRDRAA